LQEDFADGTGLLLLALQLELAGFLGKDADELVADDAALFLRIGDAR